MARPRMAMTETEEKLGLPVSALHFILYPDMRCKKCKVVKMSLRRASCNHLFCLSCVVSISENGRFFVCPIDQDSTEVCEMIDTFLTMGDLQNARVRCPYYERGCYMLIVPRHLKEHMEGCRFRPLDEYFQSHSTGRLSFTRRNILEGIFTKTVNCEWCGARVSYTDVNCEEHYKKCTKKPKDQDTVVCPHQESMGEDDEKEPCADPMGRVPYDIRRQVSRISTVSLLMPDLEEYVELEGKDIEIRDPEANKLDVQPATQEAAETPLKNNNTCLPCPIPWKRKTLENFQAKSRFRDSVSSCEWFDAEEEQREKKTTVPEISVFEDENLKTPGKKDEAVINIGRSESTVPGSETEKIADEQIEEQMNNKNWEERSKTESFNDTESDEDASSDLFTRHELEEENYRLAAVDSLMKKFMRTLVGIDMRLQNLETENVKRKQREDEVRKDLMVLESQMIRIQDVQADLWPEDGNRARSISLPLPSAPGMTEEVECLRKEVEALKKNSSMAAQKQLEAFQQMTGEVHVCHITDYARKKYDEFKQKTPCFLSESFYTGNFGYKMKLKVYLNGHRAGRDSHLSVFVHLVRGKNDRLLTWPFRTKLMIVLCDQFQGKKNHSRVLDPLDDPVNEAYMQPTGKSLNPGKGFEMFIQFQELESRKQPFLKNDSIILKVITLHRIETMISRTEDG